MVDTIFEVAMMMKSHFVVTGYTQYVLITALLWTIPCILRLQYQCLRLRDPKLKESLSLLASASETSPSDFIQTCRISSTNWLPLSSDQLIFFMPWYTTFLGSIFVFHNVFHSVLDIISTLIYLSDFSFNNVLNKLCSMLVPGIMG